MYRIKVSEDRIITYLVNSNILGDEQYEILDYDEKNSIVKLKTNSATYTYQVEYPTLKITAY